MQDVDPRSIDPRRIAKIFYHIRQAIDLLEEFLNSPTRTVVKPPHLPKQIVPPSISTNAPKLAYSVEEVRTLVGISRSALYHAIGAKELRAVKRGRRTIILATDLRSWLDHLPSTAEPRDVSKR
jgi:excisionase family DNA binding protein